MPSVIDSYSESNQDSVGSVGNDSDTPGGIAGGLAQSFTGNGGTITDCRWYIRKHNSPTGNIKAKIWTIAGTFGSTSKPNTLLGTSDNVDIATLSSSFALVTFNFTGTEQYTTTNGTHYAVSIEYANGTSTTWLEVGYDGSSGTHPGNFAFHNLSTGGAWSGANTGIDMCFYVDGVTDVTVNLTGVAGSPAVGTSSITVDFTIGSVACSPATGNITCDCSCIFGGVAASPAIGSGTVEGAETVVPIGGATEGMVVRRPRKAKREVLPVPPDVYFRLRQGAAADVITGAGRFDAAVPVPALSYRQIVIDPVAMFHATYPFDPLPPVFVSLGTGNIDIKAELYLEEIAALLDAIQER